MKLFEMSDQKYLNQLTGKAEQEVFDYVLNGMRDYLKDTAPDAEAVKAYLLDSDQTTTLTPREKCIAVHKLLEYQEINFRTTCDLIRYRMMKEAGLVDSVDEFLALFRPDTEE